MENKKLLAMLLACFMLFTSVPFTAYAAECQHTRFDDAKEEIVKDATCTKNGIKRKFCADCGAVVYDVIEKHHTEPAGDHTTKEADCVHPGSKTYICDKCGESVTEEIPATGKHNYVNKLKDETCTGNAIVGWICNDCGAVDPSRPAEEVPGTALGHATEASVVTEATCTQDGVRVIRCKREGCGYVTEEAIAVLGHTTGASTTKPADCEHAGRVVTECAVCHEIIASQPAASAAPLGHHWGAPYVSDGQGNHTATCTREGCGVTTTEACGIDTENDTPVATSAPTCSKVATATFKCEKCEYTTTVAIGTTTDAAAHVYVKTATIRAVECNKNGIDQLTCSECGKMIYQVTTKAHTWQPAADAEGNKDATCTASGSAVQECSVCHEKQTVVVPPKGHQLVSKPSVEATCLQTGTMGDWCERCQTWVNKNVAVIDKTDHNYEKVTTPASCEVDYQEAFRCKDCHTISGAVLEVEGSALGHLWSREVSEEATCVTDGVIKLTCKRDGCGKTSTEAIAAVGRHTEGEFVITPADCGHNAQGVTLCAVCEEPMGAPVDLYERYKDTDAAKAAEYKQKDHAQLTYTSNGSGKHTTGCAVCETVGTATNCSLKVISQTPATCSSYAVTVSACDLCGYTVRVTGNALDKNNHDWNVEEVRDATCDKTGLIRKTCKICGDAEYEVVPALSHTWSDVTTIITEPDCETSGSAIIVCSACGMEEVTEVAALGHEVTTKALTIATCTQTGSAVEVCTRCNKELGEVTEVAMVPHTLVEKDIPATCTQDEVYGEICSVCGERVNVVTVPGTALGHDTEETIVKAATCTQAGVKEIRCKREGCSYTSTEAVAAPGHVTGPAITEDATCNHAGRTVEKCKICDEILKETTDANKPALGHSWGKIVSDGKGNHTQTCTRGCGEVSSSACVLSAEAVAATCKEPGGTRNICKICGYETFTAGGTVDPNNHKYVSGESGEVVRPAGCTTNGIGRMKCELCGAKGPYYVIPAGAHEWSEYVTTEAATCTKEGSKTRTCSACGEEETQTIPMTQHRFGEDYVNDDVTAMLRQCQDCKYIEVVWSMDEDFQLCQDGNHVSLEDVAAKEPTCTEDGCTAGQKCANCGALVGCEVIPALGHDWDQGNYEFDDMGHLTLVRHCTRCGIADNE